MARLNRNEVGSNYSAGNVAVTASAQQMVPLRTQRVSVAFRNVGATDIYFGPTNGVTTANGYLLKPTEEYEFTEFQGALWVICGTTGDVRYFEVY